jgi:anti-sigma B factor antagonist
MINTTKHDHDIVVVRPGAERLTAFNAKTFKDEVVALIDDGATSLLIDFNDVTFLDSSGLGALAGILKKIGHRGDLVICGLNSDINQMFRICRMDRVFKIYRDVPAALQTMSEAT